MILQAPRRVETASKRGSGALAGGFEMLNVVVGSSRSRGNEYECNDMRILRGSFLLFQCSG